MRAGVVGVDVGGTFTDAFFADESGQTPCSVKSPTTRPDPTYGVLHSLQGLSEAAGFSWSSIGEVTVGTTLALNAVIEGRGAEIGLVTTRGFRDVLEIARENRRELYDLQQAPASPLVPRSLRMEADERIDRDGKILVPLDLDRFMPVFRSFIEAHTLESVAICFINSFQNPKHEMDLRDRILRDCPQLTVSASADVHRHYREYERTLITCVNAYVAPLMADYLSKLENRIQQLAPHASVRITDSVGGAMNLAAARSRPVLTMMSGPAAGVAGAAIVTRHLPIDVITMDMGGTSCDVAVIQDGQPDLTSNTSVGRFRYPLQAIDVHSIGAGGGTVAWIDTGGLLRVGPESSGSSPGPACYDRGGTRPTITDAHVVLGHLSNGLVLGGEISLNEAAADRAVRKYVAEPLEMSVVEAAKGILRVADASLVRAIETITVRRGLDPRNLGLIAFGGAAPLHAASIANTLGIKQVLVPRFGGVLCALGAVWAREHYESSMSCLKPTGLLDEVELNGWIVELANAARTLAGVGPDQDMEREVAFDMRFQGQTASLRIPVTDALDANGLAKTAEAFKARYEATFGYVLDNTATEVETIRVRMSVRAENRHVDLTRVVDSSLKPRPWRAYFGEGESLACSMWDLRGGLRPSVDIHGPAIVAGDGSTALIGPSQVGGFDVTGNLVIETVRH